MRVSSTVLSTTAAIAAPIVASGFVTGPGFTRSVVKSTAIGKAQVGTVSHNHGCPCPSCAGSCNCAACKSSRVHSASCRCLACGLAAMIEPEAHPASCACPACAPHSASCQCGSCLTHPATCGCLSCVGSHPMSCSCAACK